MQKKPLMIFAGPCVLENRNLALEIAGSLKEALRPFGEEVEFTFKGSFDKANRTSLSSYRGPGMEEGLEILAAVKDEIKVPVMTDFHLPNQALPVAEVCHVLQVPAFLCRQTDLVVEGARAAGKYGRILKIKKGQFLSPHEAQNIVEKVTPNLPKDQILLTERGSSFGYNNLVVDMASFQIMKSFGVKVVHDATHSVQQPGGLGKSSGGKREQIVVLAQAAVAAEQMGFLWKCTPILPRQK